MNKRQRELAQYNLDNEKAVLKQLEQQYQKALDDINTKIRILQSDELTQSRIYRLEYQQALKGQVEGILDKLHGDEYDSIHKYLSDSYTDAFIGTMYDLHGQGVPLITPIDQKAAVKAVMTDSKISEGLYKHLGVDTKNLKKAIQNEITRGIATGMAYSEIARNISNTTKAPLARANTIVRTEAHRIQQSSTHDAQVKAKSKGADIVRQWDASLDGDTRDTHRHLDGQIRDIDEPFEADGKSAMYPGDFGDPAEDCNCRCVTLQRAKWALGEDELQTLKDRAEFFGLDKSKDFEDFKAKYMTAVEKMAKGTEASNDWAKTTARKLPKAEKAELISYGEEHGIVIPDLKQFDGDPKLLKSGVDTLAKMLTEFPIGKKLVMSVSHSIPDGEFASVTNQHITVNAKALRNRAITEENIALGGQFASSTVEDIVVHEYGHIITAAKGNNGIEIAEKAYYNVFGKKANTDELIDFLESDISPYSITSKGGKSGTYKRKYTEVIPEILAKNNSKPNDFTKEFVKLLKGADFSEKT